MNTAKQNNIVTDWPGCLTKVAGGLVILLGSVVVLGWLTGNALLIQVQPQWVPMQFNTALVFFICGAGLLFLIFNQRQLAITCSALVLGVGLLTQLEYFFDLNLGIDQFFLEHFITVKTTHPGRMAWETALAFLLSGAGLLAASHKLPTGRRFVVYGLLGATIAAIGSGTLFGYLLSGNTPFGWDNRTHMAVHTAIGFIIFGIGLFAFALRNESLKAEGSDWITGAVGIGLATLVMSLWLSLLTYEHQQVEQIMEVEARTLKVEIVRSIKEQIGEIDDYVIRPWEYQDGRLHLQQKEGAESCLRNNPGIQAIAWIDSSMQVRWIESLLGNDFTKSLDLTLDRRRLEALEVAKFTRVATATHNIKLPQGDNAIIVYVPLYNGDRFDGFVGIVFNIRKLLEPMVDNLLSMGFGLRLFEGDKEIFHHIKSDTTHVPNVIEEDEFHVLNLDWRFSLQPSHTLLEKLKSSLPLVAMIVSLLLALLITLVLHFAQIAKRRASRLALLNQELATEIKERLRIEKSLEESNLWMQGIFNALEVGVFVVTPDRKIVNMNPVCENMLGYSQEEIVGQSTEMLNVDHAHFVEFGKRIKMAFDKGEAAQFEFELKRKNGEVFPTAHKVSLLRDSAGMTIGIVSTLRDLTVPKQIEKELHDYREQLEELVKKRTHELEVRNIELQDVIEVEKRTKATLRDSEQYLQAMFNNMHEGVITTDVNLNIESANPEALAMLGYDAEQLIGQNTEILIPASDLEQHDQGMKYYLEQDTHLHSPRGLPIGPREVTAVHADGTTFRMSMSVGEMMLSGQRKFIAIIKDISAQKLAQQALEHSSSQLRKLTSHLQTVREDERARISRDVHDEIGQVLTALNMGMHWLKNHTHSKDRDIHDKVLSLLPLISSAISTVQRITSELRPPMLDQLGLASAIQWHVETFKQQTGIKCLLSIDVEDEELDQEHATAVFRIMQEALTNVARHAGASQVNIKISKVNDHIEMEITDDGQGISSSPVDAAGAFGLLGMKERAHVFGGEVKIEGRPGDGTTVSLYLPLGNADLNNNSTDI